MDAWNEPTILFEQSTMFTKSKFCKIYKVMSQRPSGMLRHSHDYMQIWYVTKGSCEHWIEGQHYLMARGDLFLVPPRIEHRIIRLERAEIICCEFSFDHFFPQEESQAYRQVHEAALNLSFAWLFHKDAGDIRSRLSLRPKTGERVNTLMHEMLREYEGEEIYFEEFLRVQIMELLLMLARECSQSSQMHKAMTAYEKYKPMVEQAIRYVNEHYREPLKLEDVCRVSMLSKTYFCYLFKLLTQQTLVEYMMNLRIRKSIELLSNPENAITWVALEVGFSDPTHFSRTFKKVVGVSPRTYRTIKNAQPPSSAEKLGSDASEQSR